LGLGVGLGFTCCRDLDVKLHMIPGVIETGLFFRMADKAYFGQKDGTVVTKVPKAVN